MRSMTNKTISPAVAIAVTVAFVLMTACVESGTLASQERADHAPRKIDMAYCTSCHSDAAMLAKMKRKEGNTHFLFNGNEKIPAQCSAAGPPRKY